MADTDAVTWAELEKFCVKKQEHCHEVMALKTENHSRQIDSERRAGMAELETKMELLTAEVRSIKEIMEGKNLFTLPKPVLYLVCLGMIGVGAAGKELIGIVAKILGG